MLQINDNHVLGGREITLPTHKRDQYRHINNLQTDLDLVLLEMLDIEEGSPQKRFTLATVNYRLTDQEAVTPIFDCLNSLNAYIAENMHDIIQNYLFGFVEEDMELSKVLA
ncbi:MAG: hypothetical protein AseanaTS_02040 [Candidatus Pelagadaptatus aseana]|uniref:hypothetical protein n=1 Tax=Candidatus Pelagadaptatus aseana TaxID=3120508 RepID=UPI0039B2074A